ncbi:type IV pilus biogenesis protein PilM [Bacillota bacterium Lsc_1132]
MAFSLFTPKNRTINLVINDHSIRYVEILRTNPLSIQKWREHFLPPGIISDGKIVDYETLSTILQECIEDWKIHRRDLRFLVPDSLIIIRKISVPADIQEDEMGGYLYLEMGSSILLPFEDPVFDYYPLKLHEQAKDVLLFAAPEKYVLEYADLFTALKLNPIAADISPLALYRLHHHLGKAREKEILFTVQFDITSVTICIFEGAVPYVMRHFPLPFEMEKWEIQRSENATEYVYKGNQHEMLFQFEEILKEITKLMDFYKYSLNNGKKEVASFLLNGDHPSLEIIFQEMREKFDIPVKILSIDGNAQVKTDAVPSGHYLALGLALKEVK